MISTVPDIEIQVDLRNPAQFFACCGVLELASRLWSDSEGWFSEAVGEKAGTSFCISTYSGEKDPLAKVIGTLIESDEVVESDTSGEANPGLVPVTIIPFDLRLDWWRYSFGGGEKSELKTWAGQQKPEGIIKSLYVEWRKNQPAVSSSFLNNYFPIKGCFGFDPRSSWKSIDIGFSPDTQGKKIPIYPTTEILAAVGLQRFRPKQVQDEDGNTTYRYRVWNKPLEVSVAPVAMIADEINCAPIIYEFLAVKRNKSYSTFDWSKPVEEK